jgi:hypothetical protein
MREEGKGKRGDRKRPHAEVRGRRGAGDRARLWGQSLVLRDRARFWGQSLVLRDRAWF